MLGVVAVYVQRQRLVATFDVCHRIVEAQFSIFETDTSPLLWFDRQAIEASGQTTPAREGRGANDPPAPTLDILMGI